MVVPSESPPPVLAVPSFPSTPSVAGLGAKFPVLIPVTNALLSLGSTLLIVEVAPGTTPIEPIIMGFCLS